MDYTNFNADELGKTPQRPLRKYITLLSVSVALVYFGMLSYASWDQQPLDDMSLPAARVAEEMQRMMADPQQIAAEAMQLAKIFEAFEFNEEVQKTFQEKGMHIVKQVEDALADPVFVEGANIVAARMKAVAASPAVQAESERYTEQMQKVVANLHAQDQDDADKGRRLFSVRAPATGGQLRGTVRDVSAQGLTPRLTPDGKYVNTAYKMKGGQVKYKKTGEIPKYNKANLEKLKDLPPAPWDIEDKDTSGPFGGAATPNTSYRQGKAVRFKYKKIGEIQDYNKRQASYLSENLPVPSWDKREPVAAPKRKEMEQYESTVPLLSALGKLKVVTALSEAGLLTAAEKAGLFSTLEQNGLFSTAESLLPLADTFGVLKFGQEFINTPSSTVATQGAVLAALGPVYVALCAAGALEAPQGPAALGSGLVFTGTTGAGVLLLVAADLLNKLQTAGGASTAEA